MYRHDYIKRLIEQLAAAIASIAGLTKSGDFDRAEAELDQAYNGLGLNPSFLKLDPKSIARLLRDPDRIEAAAQLSEAEADLHAARGNATAAEQCRRRAEALRLEAGSSGLA